MKRTIGLLLALILVLSLAACGSNGLEQAAVIEVNTEQDNPGYVEGEDYQTAVGMYGNSFAARFTKGEGGYYYDLFGPGSLLMFYDENAGVAVPVCDRPNCPHTGGDCNAYLGCFRGIEHMQYYDGNLYVFGYEGVDISNVDLYRISADGSTREKLGTVYHVAGDSVAYDAVIHRGYAYVTLCDAGLDKRTVEVHRLSLSGNGETETVYTFEESYGASARMKAYGNYLYSRFSYYADEDGNGVTKKLYRMNIHTGETELVMTGCPYDFLANEEYLFYHRDMKVVAHNLGTQEETMILDNGYSNYFALDGNHLLCDNGAGQMHVYLFDDVVVTDPRTMTIMDVTDFSILKTLVVEDKHCELVALQDNRIYALMDREIDGDSRKSLCYCDWTALSDGDTIQWTWVEEA